MNEKIEDELFEDIGFCVVQGRLNDESANDIVIDILDVIRESCVLVPKAEHAMLMDALEFARCISPENWVETKGESR